MQVDLYVHILLITLHSTCVSEPLGVVCALLACGLPEDITSC